MGEIFFITKVFLAELLEKEATRRVTGKRRRRILCYWLAFVEFFEGIFILLRADMKYAEWMAQEKCRVKRLLHISFFIFLRRHVVAKCNGQSTKMSWDSFERIFRLRITKEDVVFISFFISFGNAKYGISKKSRQLFASDLFKFRLFYIHIYKKRKTFLCGGIRNQSRGYSNTWENQWYTVSTWQWRPFLRFYVDWCFELKITAL